jgi:hypothetical protein
MSAWLTLLYVAPAAAGLAPSRITGLTTIDSPRSADVLAVQRALENRIVAQKLRDYGVSPDEVQIRLASMSDQDVHHLASATKGLPTGGDAVGVLIGIAILVLLIIIILKLLNKDVVVK